MPRTTKPKTSQSKPTRPTEPARRSKYEIECNERNAAVQMVGDKARRERSAPRRDDLARAAYYLLLLMLAEARAQGEIEKGGRIRRHMRLIMEDTLFDPEASMKAFDDHAETVVRDLKGWAGMRRNAQRQRLEAEAAQSAAE